MRTRQMMIGNWMPRAFPWPRTVKPSGNPEMAFPPVSTNNSPRATLIMASVAMKGLIRILGDHQAVDQADPGADRQPEKDGYGNGQMPPHQGHGRNTAAQGHRGTDRQVEAAANQEDGHTDGHDALLGQSQKHGRDVEGTKEASRGKVHRGTSGHQNHHEEELGGFPRGGTGHPGRSALNRGSFRSCFPSRRKGNDVFFRGLFPGQTAGDPAVAHHSNPVAHPQQFRQVRGDHEQGYSPGGGLAQ